MSTYRVSKYRKNNSVLIDDWTSISDIGRTFNGVRLTVKRYLEVERAYLAVIFAAFILRGEQMFRLDRLEGDPADLKSAQELISKFKLDPISNLSYKRLSKSGLSIAFLPDVARLILREHIWAQIIGEKGTVVDFGYDYYCYLSMSRIDFEIGKMASCLGLNADLIKRSPYRNS